MPKTVVLLSFPPEGIRALPGETTQDALLRWVKENPKRVGVIRYDTPGPKKETP